MHDNQGAPLGDREGKPPSKKSQGALRLSIRQGWKKSKFSEWPAEFSVISSNKSKNFLLKKFLKILQNDGAHGGSKPFMRELLPP